MDVSHAILFLENADFCEAYRALFPCEVWIYNREQAPNLRHHWPDENFPVTKLTRCNVSAASCREIG